MDKKNLIIKLFKSLRGEKESELVSYNCVIPRPIHNSRELNLKCSNVGIGYCLEHQHYLLILFWFQNPYFFISNLIYYLIEKEPKQIDLL